MSTQLLSIFDSGDFFSVFWVLRFSRSVAKAAHRHINTLFQFGKMPFPDMAGDFLDIIA
jgi:hypothetical protein